MTGKKRSCEGAEIGAGVELETCCTGWVIFTWRLSFRLGSDTPVGQKVLPGAAGGPGWWPCPPWLVATPEWSWALAAAGPSQAQFNKSQLCWAELSLELALSDSGWDLSPGLGARGWDRSSRNSVCWAVLRCTAALPPFLAASHLGQGQQIF